MSATVLDFLPRAEYDDRRFNMDREDVAALTPKEVEQRVTETAFEDISRLISKLKATGRWNAVATKHMSDAVDHITKACAAIAGVKHGKTT
jgi:beta-phosphoglucomutase-like phosphatase (HAD superfamily)